MYSLLSLCPCTATKTYPATFAILRNRSRTGPTSRPCMEAEAEEGPLASALDQLSEELGGAGELAGREASA